jgi:cell division protein FtsW
MSSISVRDTGTSIFRSLGSSARGAVQQPDYWLLTIILIMVMFGTVMVFSSSFAIGVREEGGDGYYFLTRHLVYLIVGLAGMLIAMSIDYHVWQKLALPGLLLVMAVLAAMVIFPTIAPEVWGASRWVQIGPVTFQPSEFAKLALVLYLASWLASKGMRIREFNYGLIPFAVLMGLLVGLVMLQPDLGTSLLLTGIGLSMFLVAGANLLHLGLVTAIGGSAFLALALTASYRRDRILVFLNPDADLRNLGWQLAQAKLAIGSGGLFGVGLGASYQKFAWLPAAHHDAIFAVIAEELGLMGAGFVLMLFIMLAWRGYRVAMRAPDSFGSLVAVGIVTWMIFQAAINIGGITTTIPFTGIPIPFISYGGSSLVVSLVAMGILLNVSRQTVDPISVKVRSNLRGVSTRARRKPAPRPKPEAQRQEPRVRASRPTEPAWKPEKPVRAHPAWEAPQRHARTEPDTTSRRRSRSREVDLVSSSGGGIGRPAGGQFGRGRIPTSGRKRR